MLVRLEYAVVPHPEHGDGGLVAGDVHDDAVVVELLPLASTFAHALEACTDGQAVRGVRNEGGLDIGVCEKLRD